MDLKSKIICRNIVLTLAFLPSCTTKQKPRQASLTRVQSAAAITKIPSSNHFKLMAQDHPALNYCYINKSKKIYFINNKVHQNATEFLQHNLPGYSGLTKADYDTMRLHPYLREMFCGQITKGSKKAQYLFSIEEEEALSFAKIKEITLTMRKRMRIPKSKVFFVYQSKKLFEKNRRIFAANAMVVKHISEIEDQHSQSLLTEDAQNKSHLSIIKYDTNTTAPVFSQPGNSLAIDQFGYPLSKKPIEDYALSFPFALHQFLLEDRIRPSTCDLAKKICRESQGNLCQFPHGLCLSFALKKRKKNFNDLAAHLLGNKAIQVDTASSFSLRKGTLAFLRGAIHVQSLDDKLVNRYLDSINSEFADAEVLEMHPRLNVANNALKTSSSLYLCLKKPKQAMCKDSNKSLKDQFKRRILDAYAFIYTEKIFSLFENQIHELSKIRAAISVTRKRLGNQYKGYVYIFPNMSSKAFNLKVINTFDFRKGEPKQSSQAAPIYLTVSPLNKVIKKDFIKSKDFPKEIVDSLILNVKKEYLKDLGKNKGEDNRLYSYTYEVNKEQHFYLLAH